MQVVTPPPMITRADERKELDNRFDYHPPSTDEVVKLHEDTRAKAKTLARWVHRNVPEGRERSLAITKIEEALFWANAGIARHGNEE